MFDLWRELVRRNAPLAWVGLAHLVLFVALACLVPFDAGEIQGIDRWFKPMKFAVSIAIYVWTLAWFLHYLKPSGRRLVGVISWVVAVTMSIEIFFIVIQPARGAISHFNNATPLDAGIFSFMGVAIMINSLAAFCTLILFFISTPRIPTSYLWGIRLGLLVFLLASAEGGFMVGHGSRYVPDNVSLGSPSPGLPFVNWSRREGDLRVAHFVGLHALQVIPLVGFLLHLYSRKRRLIHPVAWTIAFAVIYAALAAGLFIQAMAERPLLAEMPL